MNRDLGCIMLGLFLLLPVIGCKKKPSRQQSKSTATVEKIMEKPLKLGSEIVTTPRSPLSVNAAIVLGFRDAMVPGHLSGIELDKNPFEFTPSIKGSAKWNAPDELRFTPEHPLPAGVTFNGKLIGTAAFGSNRTVDDFTFTFKTADQEVISFTGDFDPDSSGKDVMRFKGTLQFAQKVAMEVISKDLTCTVKDRPIKLTLSSDATGSSIVKIVSQPLKRGTKGYTLVFSLPEKYTAEKGAWHQEMYLPESNLFKIMTHMDLSEPDAKERVYGFRCTDPVKTGLDLSGFVEIKPEIACKVVADGKYLKIQGGFVPGETYSITIRKGFPSALNMALNQDYRTSFTFTNTTPQFEWLSQGIILPSSNRNMLQFKTNNLSKIHITVTEIFSNNIGFFLQKNILSSPEKNRKSSYGYEYEYEDEEYYYGNNTGCNDLERVGKTIYEDSLEPGFKVNTWVQSELDLGPVLAKKRNSIFVVTATFTRTDVGCRCTNDRDSIDEGVLYFASDNYYNNPCNNSYYYRNGTKQKLLIASDIACTVKRTREGVHLYAVNTVEGQPARNVEFGLYTYHNQLMAKATTDNDGHLFFSGTINDTCYLRGSGEHRLALFKLNSSSWEINNFDVGGATGGIGGCNVFPYTDRGVYRPGDTIHLCGMIRYERNNPDAAQPVSLTVFNTLKQKVYEARSVCGEQGLVYFPIPTSKSSATGDWQAVIETGGIKVTHPLKVEMIKPNRFKVTIPIPDTLRNARSVNGAIEAKYLFGTPAAGCKAEVHCYFESKQFCPSRYQDYIFTNPQREFTSRKKTMFNDVLDDEGKAKLSVELTDATTAPGLIGAVATATVYEEGGGFTRQSKRMTIVPYASFVGIRTSFRYGYAGLGEKYALPVVCVDVQGKPVSGHMLRVKHYFNRNHWWWDYSSRSRRDFRTITTTVMIDEQLLQSSKVPQIYTLEVEDYGQHFVEVTDETSGHTTGFFVYGSSWDYGKGGKGAPLDRNFLDIASDKNIYAPGDKMTLSFPSPKEGMAIVSIEAGDRILEQRVIDLQEGSTTISFTVSEAMLPNCYAVVSLIQPQKIIKNDIAARIYGIKTIIVEDRQSHLPLSVAMPDELEPGRTFTVEVSSAATRAAGYTVALVDEGLLDLTGFATPDPWKHYYQKIRLGVVTSDNFEEVIGMPLPDIDQTFSIGGSESMEMRAGVTSEQRFKPVVLFTGLQNLKPGETAKHTFTMPNYVGSVRLMVIGCAGKYFSTYEKAVPVRAPLMILTTVPRIARPLDRFALPVSVFSTDSAIRTVTLKLQVSSALHIDGSATLPVTFERPGERDTAFMVNVGEAIGAATISVTARSGTQFASDSVTLPLASANPFYTDVIDTALPAKGSLTLQIKPLGLRGTNSARLAFSRIPDLQLQKRLGYLIRYPYGCIEQTTSSVFPQLYIGYLSDLTSAQKKEMSGNVDAGIKRLATFLLPSGGFSYWPGNRDYCDWGTTYATHFLAEAQNAGYHVPASLMQSSLRRLAAHAKKTDMKNHRLQSYRLLVLAIAGKPHMGAMNLMRENYLAKMDPLSRILLATAYHLAGQQEIAKRITGYAPTEVTSFRETGGSFGSSLRDRALITWCTVTMGDPMKAAKLLHSISREFRTNNWYSTQETAMALLALSALYYKSPASGGDIPFSVSIAGGKAEKMQCKGYQTEVNIDAALGKSVTITNYHGDPLFCSLLREGIPLHSTIETSHSNLEVARNFYDDDGNPLLLNQITQGKPFWIRYRVQGTTSETVNNIALTSMIPSGWEIINLRLEGLQYPEWVKNFNVTEGTYMDIRDDRINWFFDIYSHSAINVAVKINPSFRGTYRLPPVVAEAMYSPEYYARLAGDSVEVK